MKISIIGTGYVGLVSATCLADSGHAVTCVDVRRELVADINKGRAPVFEKGLQERLQDAVLNGRLKASTDLRSVVLDSDVSLVCVGTPNNGSGMDLTQIVSAAEGIGGALRGKSTYHVIAVRSTVLPGTTEGIVKDTIESQSGRTLGDKWGLCMNPEFLREGHAVEDFLCPDRVVIGASDDRAARMLLEVYRHQNCPKLVTSLRTAEMIKYVANSLFATMISFSNEMANICEGISGVNAQDVWRGVHLDRRLTFPGGQAAGMVEYLWHGLGFGGSCFPKDVAALRGLAKQLGASNRILEAVLETNAIQPLKLVNLLEQEMAISGKKIAVLGLAFKPGTDDLRESPAIPVVDALERRGAHVIVHDPVAMPKAQDHSAFQRASFAADWSSALKDADGCCVITSWDEYKLIRPEDFVALMKRPLVVDGRGLFDPKLLANSGVVWRGIGYAHDKRTFRGPSPLGSQEVSDKRQHEAV